MADDFTHRFSTKPFDVETGYSKYQQRDYIPPLARWACRDPIGEAAFGVLNNEMAQTIRRERLKDLDLLNRIALADQIGVADAYLFVGNSPVSSYDYLGLSWISCWGNCIEKWRWDWGATLGIALTPGTPIGKLEIEKLWTSAGVSEQTTWLSRAVGQGNRLLMKLPLGSPVRTKLVGALKNIRWAARNPAVVGASTAASLFVVLEGFYDIGVEVRCGVECCIDLSAYLGIIPCPVKKSANRRRLSLPRRAHGSKSNVLNMPRPVDLKILRLLMLDSQRFSVVQSPTLVRNRNLGVICRPASIRSSDGMRLIRSDLTLRMLQSI